MRLSIFRVRSLAVADTVLLLLASGMFGMFFFASLYIQQILGYSPLKAGLAFLPVTAVIMIGAGLAQQLIRRFGVRNVGAFGIALASVGLLLLTQLPVHGSYAGDVLPGLLPLGLGLGLAFVPITLLGTSGVREEDNGLASGLFNTAQQVGGSLGLAVLSTLAASQAARVLNGTGLAAIQTARVSGYHVAFLAAAIMLASGSVLLMVALRRSHLREVEAAIEAGVQPIPA
jgi:predicted MFS family arabinose efflux permease